MQICFFQSWKPLPGVHPRTSTGSGKTSRQALAGKPEPFWQIDRIRTTRPFPAYAFQVVARVRVDLDGDFHAFVSCVIATIPASLRR